MERALKRMADVTTSADKCVYVLLCTDASFLQHTAVCLASLLANNSHMFFNVVIACRASGGSLDEDKFSRSIAKFENVTIAFQTFSPAATLSLPIEAGAHHTIDTYSRLWVGTFFSDDVNRVLYLDGDLVVTGDIAPLWEIDLAGALIAAVDVPGSDVTTARLGTPNVNGYFNAGVLVIDLTQWRETRALDTVLDCIAGRSADLRHDQDALNICFHARWKRVGYEWNAMSPFFDPSFYETPFMPFTRREINAICQRARIIHFNGPIKPWSYLCEHPRRKAYWRYLRMTEWRRFVPPDRTLGNMARRKFRSMRNLVSSTLPQQCKPPLKAMLHWLNQLLQSSEVS